MSVQKKKKTGKRRNFAGFLVILILVGVMTVQVIRVYGRVSDARTQEAQIAAQVEQRKQENAALEPASARATTRSSSRILPATSWALRSPASGFLRREPLSIPAYTRKGEKTDIYGTGGWEHRHR